MIYLFWCAMLTGLALAFGTYFKKGLEETLAPAIFTSVMVLYLSGIFGFLYAGLWLVAALGLCGLLFWLIQAVRQKSLLLYSWFTPGSLILAAAVLYILFIQNGKMVIGNDEFSHWATTVKLMFYTDDLGIYHSSELLFPSYCPGLSLFQYLFIRFTPAFTESYLFRAMSLFLVSLILPVLKRYRWRNLGTALAAFVTLFLLPLTLYSDFYSNLQVDGTLALLQCYILFVWFTSRKTDAFTLVQLSLGVSMLVLTKDSGIAMAAIALAVIIWDSLSQCSGKSERLLALKRLAFPAGSMLLAKISWSVVVSSQIPTVHKGGSGLLSRLALLFAPWEERWVLSLRHFIHRLTVPLEIESTLHPTMLIIIVLGFVLLGAACTLLPNRGLHRAVTGLAVSLTVCSAGLLYLYFFQFSSYEGINIASMNRYMGSWILPLLLLGMELMFDGWVDFTHKTVLLPASLMLCTFLLLPINWVDLSRLAQPAFQISHEHTFRSGFLTPETFPFPLEEGDQMYFVADDTTVYEMLCASYSAAPANFCSNSLGYNLNPDNPDYSLWASDVSAEAWAEELKQNYTYVYLYNTAPGFVGRYGSLFEDPSTIGRFRLYRVNPEKPEGFLEFVWSIV